MDLSKAVGCTKCGARNIDENGIDVWLKRPHHCNPKMKEKWKERATRPESFKRREVARKEWGLDLLKRSYGMAQ